MRKKFLFFAKKIMIFAKKAVMFCEKSCNVLRKNNLSYFDKKMDLLRYEFSLFPRYVFNLSKLSYSNGFSGLFFLILVLVGHDNYKHNLKSFLCLYPKVYCINTKIKFT